jgi:hypothetical protein
VPAAAAAVLTEPSPEAPDGGAALALPVAALTTPLTPSATLCSDPRVLDMWTMVRPWPLRRSGIRAEDTARGPTMLVVSTSAASSALLHGSRVRRYRSTLMYEGSAQPPSAGGSRQTRLPGSPLISTGVAHTLTHSRVLPASQHRVIDAGVVDEDVNVPNLC